MISTLMHKLVQRFGLPPWLNGYRSLQSLTAEEFCKAYPDLGRFEQLRNSEVIEFPLPRNVASRKMLNSVKRENLPHSFYDVPELKIDPAYEVHLKNSLLVRWTNKWKKDFYAVISANQKNILVPGVGYSPGHSFFIHEKEFPSYKEGSFFLGMWYKNYSLWLTVYMSKLFLAMERKPQETIVIPEFDRLTPVNRKCLEIAGVKKPIILSNKVNCWHFESLTLFHENPYRGEYLKKFRDNVLTRVHSGIPKRKIYVSRKNANYRHVENEKEVHKLFLGYGWEIYRMEDLDFMDQVLLMSEAVAFASLHGAGFGNIVFCNKGAHILEFGFQDWPNANFYSLAACLGHHYWLGEAKPCGKKSPAVYDDAFIDCRDAEKIIKMIEFELQRI